jgi:hypothetical protein
MNCVSRCLNKKFHLESHLSFFDDKYIFVSVLFGFIVSVKPPKFAKTFLKLFILKLDL